MEYDIGPEESVSVAVVCAVSAVQGEEPNELAPLAGVCDPDALDALFAPRADGTPRTGGRISFVYAECRVTVESSEYIAVRPLDACTNGGRAPGAESDGRREEN